MAKDELHIEVGTSADRVCLRIDERFFFLEIEQSARLRKQLEEVEVVALQNLIIDCRTRQSGEVQG